MKYILSIDGGGMYGVVPAQACIRIESRVGKPIAEIFDLMVGTSTGAILSSGFAKGVSAREAMDFYFSTGKGIFTDPRNKFLGLFRRKPKYKGAHLQRVMEDHFGEMRLGDLGPEPKVAITTYDMTNGRARIFKSWNEDHASLRLSDVIRASSSTPTALPMVALDDGCYTDGGVFATNPSVFAFAEAARLYRTEDILMLSIGTGRLPRRRGPCPQTQNKGELWWAREIPGVFLDGQQVTADYVLGWLSKSGRESNLKYYRFDPELLIPSTFVRDPNAYSKHGDELTPRVLMAARQSMDNLIDLTDQRDFDDLIGVLKSRFEPAEPPSPTIA